MGYGIFELVNKKMYEGRIYRYMVYSNFEIKKSVKVEYTIDYTLYMMLRRG